MQIANVLSRATDLLKPGRKAEAESGKTKATESSSAATGNSAAMREILAEYDVANISPRSFSEMLQKLNQTGALPDKDYQELSLVRLDLDREGIDPDERVNLVDLYAKKTEQFQRELRDFQEKTGSLAPTEAMGAAVQKRFDWLSKFAAIHANPAAGVNAMA
jgi:hypothetical protein